MLSILDYPDKKEKERRTERGIPLAVGREMAEKKRRSGPRARETTARRRCVSWWYRAK